MDDFKMNRLSDDMHFMTTPFRFLWYLLLITVLTALAPLILVAVVVMATVGGLKGPIAFGPIFILPVTCAPFIFAIWFLIVHRLIANHQVRKEAEREADKIPGIYEKDFLFFDTVEAMRQSRQDQSTPWLEAFLVSAGSLVGSIFCYAQFNQSEYAILWWLVGVIVPGLFCGILALVGFRPWMIKLTGALLILGCVGYVGWSIHQKWTETEKSHAFSLACRENMYETRRIFIERRKNELMGRGANFYEAFNEADGEARELRMSEECERRASVCKHMMSQLNGDEAETTNWLKGGKDATQEWMNDNCVAFPD
jgi:hypothetical protein